MHLSIVIPAKNEEQGLSNTLPRLAELYPEAEIIVVDDGSTDGTRGICEASGVKVLSQPYSKGNGAAIKAGARAASGDVIVFMDGDGQHDPMDIERLLYKMDEGYDMVVGARSGLSDQASIARWGANGFYNRLASWMVNKNIPDLTSGFRAVRRKKFLGFLYLLPNGFSYPTTSTMAFFRAGYSVGFVPISVSQRVGKSHINVLRDGVRFLLIIFKIGTLYSPLKVYFPTSVAVAGIGFLNYLLAWAASGSFRFTNMSTLLVLAGMIIFLMGLLSEQLTNLQYKDADADPDDE
ncbi:glycosyltransferase family 2 protein [Parahaliea aestuarii]|uniref:Glycosyltransferase family 2 protein n=1 Tax=Parahaliea aestuarii TaxID=1852021 RepID=A0A5C9A5E3_9GAMM|nr:glycosyltransferase family 2 protein [Parahaliea aestuarii]TXS94960.1 glycosyltransferase family 2 protein [Parahaliea aestuarii]